MKFKRLPMILLAAWVLPLPVNAADENPPSFSRDIRPILAAKCFACHGPDESHREAKLRLDLREVAVKALAIVPGKPNESGMMGRIAAVDPEERMPPPETGAGLTEREQDLLHRWIADGAKYEQHWSFVRPARPATPTVNDAAWPINEIDAFVLARLEQEGLRPSTAAEHYTLIRRVYLDLIGLPPTPQEADAFVLDDDPKAYEKLVDRLLASQHYGEHWARRWLDLARFADTNGYEKDRPRSIWPYRDWVIRAVNDDMPFDQFTIEQLAGDMLPDATDSQRIATGFHRNTMINEEGGIDPLEFRFYAMVDRVATTGTVWLGLTTGCAQCHTHKYDPITHADYYGLMALLNNADEPEMIVRDQAVEQQRRTLQNRIDKLEEELPARIPPSDGEGAISARRQANLATKFAEWLKLEQAQSTTWQTLRPASMRTNLPRLELLNDGSIYSSGDITKRDVFTLRFQLVELDGPITALRLEVLPDERLPAQGPGQAYYEGRKGDFFLSELKATSLGKPVEFAGGSHSYGKISIGSGSANAENVFDGEGSTGWSTSGAEGERNQLVLNLKQPLEAKGDLEIELLFERHFAASLGRFRLSATSAKHAAKATRLPIEIENLLAQNENAFDDTDLDQLRAYFLSVSSDLADARKQIESLRKQLPELPTTMVLRERPADNTRPTFRHHRGEFLAPKENVSPGLPAFLAAPSHLPSLPTDAVANRLSFARWLVSDRNPLVGRVTVNREWLAFFGHGCVPTADEFGTQGDSPTHPQLLDWLAVAFTTPKSDGGLGWSRKQLHRLIVTSATYRQSSQVTPTLLERDRDNQLLARGPRFRADAETVRDILLTASGLLTRRVGGPSVYPPQPSSVTALAYGNEEWKASTGADRFRRSVYTFRKRTAPFAAYTVFDAPTGENCTVGRNRSNTPLQSLTLLNDDMFLEIARALAEQAVASGKTPDARAAFLFRALLTRPPRQTELETIVAYERAQSARLESKELDHAVVWGRKESSVELAAWFLVARALINLDETITKQ